jgi:methylmalonyl-CoA/ethylmalonyl-CoA epimerase
VGVPPGLSGKTRGIVIRHLDHVGIVVRDTEAALTHFRDRLGLPVAAVDEPPEMRVQLTYLDMGNAYLQLVEPLDDESPIAEWLHEHGEGLHHICFAVDDLVETLAHMRPVDEDQPPLGSGRGQPTAFLAGEPRHGVRIECTEIHGSGPRRQSLSTGGDRWR